MQGLVAVLLWGGLAALAALAGPVPPFQLAALTFTVGTLVGFVYAAFARQNLSALKTVPFSAWAFGVWGLLTFHVCYFFAVQQAPPVDASLIIYTWPLLIVLLSGLLPANLGGTGLRFHHIVGALLGFGGTALILTSAADDFGAGGTYWGYVSAVAAAFIWSTYSVGSRLFSHIPSIAVIGSCAATAIGAGIFHIFLETTHWPESSMQWAAVVGLGLGPVGLAFYVWDEGMKHGDIRLLGVGAYATPLLSTGILALFGLGKATPILWLAALLITTGALVAAYDKLFSRSK